MSWNTVDIGEEEYPGQAQGCGDEWGPCGHDHRPSMPEHRASPDEYAHVEQTPSPRIDTGWPFYGVCDRTGTRLYPTEASAHYAEALIRDWATNADREYRQLKPERCAHDDHWHLRYS